MTGRLRRATAFAAIGSLTIAAPSLGLVSAVPFAVIALVAVFVVSSGPVFELFARPTDRESGQLYGLAGFAFAAAALTILATAPRSSMPDAVLVATVVAISAGQVGSELCHQWTDDELIRVGGFVGGGTAAAMLAQGLVALQLGTPIDPARFGFLGVIASLIAAIIRQLLYERDDPVVVITTGLLLWGAAALVSSHDPVYLLSALIVTGALGYVSYALGTASIAGALTGVLLGLVTIVYGGFGWFAVLITFYGTGALASKFRYEKKYERGVAEDNDGARGTGNVLGNSTVALVAVLGFAAADGMEVSTIVFVVAFSGSLATALGDTLSSEIGGLFDTPRLITTLEQVEPGTDGAITWQGEVAGLAGCVAIGAVSAIALPVTNGPLTAAAIAIGGVVGITVDSILGATVEGGRIGNQGVNFLATVGGAVGAITAAIGLGLT
ncbi:DUF92 domain-containing protein [Halalkalirubrum salinum]|uniref:DUF92 domain-containing protein n=1 Tax=Halalkalirubrum salinum TaxID=2563889 RepID=UPI0010FB74C5|nr:DUF92 domain-containing protein [Halalkalirubrum salinum]